MKLSFVSFFFLLLFTPGFAQSVKYSYINRFGTNRSLSDLETVKSEDGYNAFSNFTNSFSNSASSAFRLDDSYATLDWYFTNLSADTAFHAVRESNTIRITGIFKGKKYDNTRAIGDFPWIQEWNNGCSELVRRGNTNFIYYSINQMDPSMGMTFKGVFLKEEAIDVNNETVKALHYRISLTGLLEAFWSADFWFRKSDGRYIRSVMKSPNGQMVSELVSETGR